MNYLHDDVVGDAVALLRDKAEPVDVAMHVAMEIYIRSSVLYGHSDELQQMKAHEAVRWGRIFAEATDQTKEGK